MWRSFTGRAIALRGWYSPRGVPVPHYYILASVVWLNGCAYQTELPPGGNFDAGQVFAERTSKVQHAFIVKNTTGRRVKIINVKASCACTTSQLSKYELESGESTELVLSAPVPKTYNKAALFCTLVTDALNLKEWNYSLHFESIPRLMVSPTSFNLGVFKASDFDARGVLQRTLDPAVFVLDLFSFGEDIGDHTLSVSGVEGLITKLEPKSRLEKASNGIWHRCYKLFVSFDGLHTPASGNQARTITVKTADGGQADSFISWRLNHPITVTPSLIHFGVVEAGKESTPQHLTLRSNDGKPFRIISVCGPPNASYFIRSVESTSSVRSAETQIVDIVLEPRNSGQLEVLSGVIQIATDEETMASLQIPCSAFVSRSKNPEASVAPGRIQAFKSQKGLP